MTAGSPGILSRSDAADRQVAYFPSNPSGNHDSKVKE